MYYILTFLISLFEWIALLLFPIVLLGYYYKKYLGPIILLGMTMSILSLILHITTLHVSIIIAFQIITLLLLIRFTLRMNNLETFVVTSIGYGFYIFTQMIFIEIAAQSYGYQYLQFFTSIDIKTTIQVLTFVFVFLLCVIIQHFKYQLNELRYNLVNPYLNKKYRNILVSNSLLTFVFVCFIFFTMLAEEFSYKYMFILIILVILFIILASYLVLHTKFQTKRLIETKKFYLDQEQHIGMIVANLKKDYESHFQAISKLSEKENPQLVKEYIQKYQLSMKEPMWKPQTNLRSDLEQVDELVYTFLINKRKLANLLGVTINVTTNITADVPVTLRQIRNLSMAMDDLIFTLYKTPANIDKTIDFEVRTVGTEIQFLINSNINLDDPENSNLTLLDAILQFKKDNAVVHSNLKPVQLSITCH